MIAHSSAEGFAERVEISPSVTLPANGVEMHFVTICARHNDDEMQFDVLFDARHTLRLRVNCFSERRDLIVCHLCQLPSFRDIIIRLGVMWWLFVISQFDIFRCCHGASLSLVRSLAETVIAQCSLHDRFSAQFERLTVSSDNFSCSVYWFRVNTIITV